MILILQKCVREMKFEYKFSINEISFIKCIYCSFLRNNYLILPFYINLILVYKFDECNLHVMCLFWSSYMCLEEGANYTTQVNKIIQYENLKIC